MIVLLPRLQLRPTHAARPPPAVQPVHRHAQEGDGRQQAVPGDFISTHLQYLRYLQQTVAGRGGPQERVAESEQPGGLLAGVAAA